ncbi:MAG: hypothetical protein ACRC5R_05395 [Mycoplasmatales bacterium]
MKITKEEVLNEIELLVMENELSEVKERLDLLEEYLFLMDKIQENELII